MKKIILTLIFLISTSMADSVLLVKKGWQLIGSSLPIEDMSRFDSQNVEEIWHFDASTQKWRAYSPDASIQQKIDAKKIPKLTHLKNWHGFWVKSKKDWSMIFKEKALNATPSNAKNSDVIELKKGWNLISLPVNTVVSAEIFKGMTTWKYNNQKWELSDKRGENPSFTKIGHIKNSDGIWVKAENNKNISVIEESSKLHNFKTTQAMKSYIKEMAVISRRPICGIMPLYRTKENFSPLPTAVQEDDTDSSARGSATNTSGTNLQESNVDESDILKHNGKYIFYIGKDNNKRNYINVTSFEKLTQTTKEPISKIKLSEQQSINSFYLVENKLIVLSILYPQRKQSSSNTQERVATTSIQTVVDIYDVSNINNISKLSNFKLDGYINNSRVIGENLYLITHFNPKYNITYPKEYLTLSPTCEEFFNSRQRYDEKNPNRYAECYDINKEDNRYFRYNYDQPKVTFTDILPEIEKNGVPNSTLVTPQRLYASAKQNQETAITTISNFSLADATYKQSTSYIGYNSITYASSKSLFLVSNNYPYYYDFNNYKSRSTIYKFNFDESLSYRAVGSVYGTALNQFSLSQYNNILRIATTEGFSWRNGGTKNSLYTLKEENGLMKTEGVLAGLGKEGERIKSVRFMGNRAYLVTFKTKDPLYTLDLSDPKQPKKVGELEIKGYSAYLHPIGENQLLGIGQDADNEGRRKGVKIELFDISDFQNPSSLASVTLGEGTYSELERNHKALAFRASDNLFAFPYIQNSISNFVEGDEETGTASVASAPKSYLGIFQVKANTLLSYKSIEENGKNTWGAHRGLIFDKDGKTYIAFFANDTVITKSLTKK